VDLLVDRADLRHLRIDDAPAPALRPGQARLAIERFALTANNVTYGAIGDLLGYWAAFPAPDGWGRVPVWGYARVVESAHDDLEVGRRVFGFLPMSTELVVDVDRAGPDGFTDAAPHRATLAATYNRYLTARPDEGPGSAAEDRRALLYGLFVTSYLVVDFLDERGWFGASTVVISSASSKTALGIARLARAGGAVRVVGLTSPGNVGFVEGLAVCDEVLAYGAVGQLAVEPSAYVDVSGDGAVRAAIHERLGDELRHDMVLGGTHWEAMGGGEPLPGPTPTMFFAPSQIAARAEQWGRAELDRRMDEAWAGHAAWAAGWLHIEHRTGLDEVAARSAPSSRARCPPPPGSSAHPMPAPERIAPCTSASPSPTPDPSPNRRRPPRSPGPPRRRASSRSGPWSTSSCPRATSRRTPTTRPGRCLAASAPPSPIR